MTYPAAIREEELKNKVAADLFPSFDCTSILGNVDFCVRPSAGGPGSVRTAQQPLWEAESLLWAEAKNGVRADFAVRHCIEADWLNDRDQFLWPADTWKTDREFQLDCLVFTLFHGKNRISCRSANGSHRDTEAQSGDNNLRVSVPLCETKTIPNHWIPFFEDEVGARDCMKSHFMAEFLGKCANVKALPTANASDQLGNGDLRDWQQFPDGGLLFAAEDGPEWDRESIFAQSSQSASLETSRTSRTSRETISPAAQHVLDAGRELWRYYHAQPGALPDASFYDIRAHFQGFKPGGHMNPDSPDAEYMRLISSLRTAMKALAARIAPKVREYGFLK